MKRVERSDALLKIAYEPQLYRIDEETTDKLRAFFEDEAGSAAGPIELRTFASSGIGSVSEARRVAFYRAMTVRSVAVAAGIDAGRVRIVLRESEREEDADTVLVFASRDHRHAAPHPGRRGWMERWPPMTAGTIRIHLEIASLRALSYALLPA